MHKGRTYAIDQRLRTYCGNVPYPQWFPEGGFIGSAALYWSTDWTGTEPIFTGPMVLTGWSYGDSVLVYESETIVRNGRSIVCKMTYTLNATKTALNSVFDVFVNGVQQIRTPSSSFPAPDPQPAGYADSFQFATPATPFKCQRKSVVWFPDFY